MPEEKLKRERKDRYVEKLEKITERTKNIEEWLEDGVAPLLQNTERRLATYKAFQEVAEAITDICAMFAADNEMVVSDDYENIDKASGKLFSDEIREKIGAANGLRNRIIHEYNRFEDERALDSLENLLKPIRKFKEEARK